MPDDLADRISDGVVAVLELVPGEKRFVDLSRHVLKGGAERFRPVVLTDEPVRYLVPVGVPGKKLDFGTLLSRAHVLQVATPEAHYQFGLQHDDRWSELPIELRRVDAQLTLSWFSVAVRVLVLFVLFGWLYRWFVGPQ